MSLYLIGLIVALVLAIWAALRCSEHKATSLNLSASAPEPKKVASLKDTREPYKVNKKSKRNKKPKTKR